ncbi:hypothetical protein LTR53_002126 [Teratosphaeriaceae sp. CCFEE 6253]|nr:hypothetical protein LTR53_002126 [Teratosphaeriaceae sp. CCFEE 6253]
MAYNISSWAGVCRKAAGLKFVQNGTNSWITEDLAKKAGVKVVQPANAPLMTASFARQQGYDCSSASVAHSIPTAAANATASTKSGSDESIAMEQDNLNLDPVEPFPILALPAELRLIVFGFLIESTYQLLTTYGGPMVPPQIARSCRLFRSEYLKLAIEQTTFSVHSYIANTSFQQWLALINISAGSSYSDGFDAIKRLDLPFFSRYPYNIFPANHTNSDLELALKCRNLESISLNWVGVELISQTSTGQPVGKSLALLRRQFRLDRMLELRNLTSVKLVKRQVGAVELEALERLAEWLRTHVKDKNGKGPEVTIE